MQNHICCIRDNRTNVYSAVSVVRFSDDFKRQVVNAAKNVQSGLLLSSNPDDFDLIELGTFDDETGVIVPSVTNLGKLQGYLVEAKKDGKAS